VVTITVTAQHVSDGGLVGGLGTGALVGAIVVGAKVGAKVGGEPDENVTVLEQRNSSPFATRVLPTNKLYPPFPKAQHNPSHFASLMTS